MQRTNLFPPYDRWQTPFLRIDELHGSTVFSPWATKESKKPNILSYGRISSLLLASRNIKSRRHSLQNREYTENKRITFQELRFQGKTRDPTSPAPLSSQQRLY